MSGQRDVWCGLDLDAWAKGVLRGDENQIGAMANLSTANMDTMETGFAISMRPVAEAVRREALAGLLEALAAWVRK